MLPDPCHEEERLATLRAYRIMDTAPEPNYDGIVRIASMLCHTPIALIGFIDRDRQWFKSVRGLDGTETPREATFCKYVVQSQKPMVVEDARLDPRFRENPSVVGGPRIRFYAGVPVRAANGAVLGTLCTVDSAARTIDDATLEALHDLSREVETQLELRRLLREHEESVDAQTALRHRNDMLASLAHELRTPLTALTLRLDRLATSVRAATDDPLIAKQTVAVEVHARRLNDRVRDLIEAQRLSHFVEVPLLYASVDLAEMARAVVEVQAPSASKHESPVTVSGATDVYGTWDAERVEQILGALLSNAIAYGEGKPIDVRIQSDGVVATVDVVDRGPGIDAVDRERIFEQFERGPGARARGGFGLGLWVARKAARAHGGDIELETEPRRGSTFRVRLPLEPPTLSTKTAAASNAAPMTAMPQR